MLISKGRTIENATADSCVWFIIREPPQNLLKIYFFQENVPGSNEFADEGANPIWQVAQESNDFDEDFK